jgi:hypothetical protein
MSRAAFLLHHAEGRGTTVEISDSTHDEEWVVRILVVSRTNRKLSRAPYGKFAG